MTTVTKKLRLQVRDAEAKQVFCRTGHELRGEVVLQASDPSVLMPECGLHLKKEESPKLGKKMFS